MRRAMADILTAFRPGRTGWLAQLSGRAPGRADPVRRHQGRPPEPCQHPRLTAITAAMLRGRATAPTSLARGPTPCPSPACAPRPRKSSVRTADLPAVRGRADGRPAGRLLSGELPANPAELLIPRSRARPAGWTAITRSWISRPHGTRCARATGRHAYPAGPRGGIPDRRQAIRGTR